MRVDRTTLIMITITVTLIALGILAMIGKFSGPSPGRINSGQPMPLEQLYYWTPEWQADEQEAAAELARGEGREFDNVDDALRWLETED